jgi:hypothetical protein
MEGLVIFPLFLVICEAFVANPLIMYVVPAWAHLC